MTVTVSGGAVSHNGGCFGQAMALVSKQGVEMSELASVVQ